MNDILKLALVGAAVYLYMKSRENARVVPVNQLAVNPTQGQRIAGVYQPRSPYRSVHERPRQLLTYRTYGPTQPAANYFRNMTV